MCRLPWQLSSSVHRFFSAWRSWATERGQHSGVFWQGRLVRMRCGALLKMPGRMVVSSEFTILSDKVGDISVCGQQVPISRMRVTVLRFSYVAPNYVLDVSRLSAICHRMPGQLLLFYTQCRQPSRGSCRHGDFKHGDFKRAF